MWRSFAWWWHRGRLWWCTLRDGNSAAKKIGGLFGGLQKRFGLLQPAPALEAAPAQSAKPAFTPPQAAAPDSNADKVMKPFMGPPSSEGKGYTGPSEGSHLPSIGDPYFPHGYTVPTTPPGVDEMLRGAKTVNPNVTPGQGMAKLAPQNGAGVPGAAQQVPQQAAKLPPEWAARLKEESPLGNQARAAYEDWKANPEAYRDPIGGNLRAQYIYSQHQPYGVVSSSGGPPGSNIRDSSGDAMRNYLAYQGHAAGMQNQAAAGEHALAQAASARAGGLPTTPQSIGLFKEAQNLKAKNPEAPGFEGMPTSAALAQDPTAEIGDFARGLAADRIPQGSPQWMSAMQGYMARRKTNPQELQNANEPRSFGWNPKAGGSWGLGGLQFSQGQTPQSQENMRIINEILRRNTGGSVGGL